MTTPNFTEEQTKFINEMVANAVKSAMQKPAEQNPAPQKQENEQKQSISEEAKKMLENQKETESVQAQIESSIAFNMQIEDFVNKNKNLLPPEAVNILATIKTKTFASHIEKANVLRKNLLDSYLEKKENIDPLTETMKAKAEKYKSLAESDKERKSNEFWDLIETGSRLKEAEIRTKERNLANGVSTDGSSRSIIEDKILAKAKEIFKLN